MKDRYLAEFLGSAFLLLVIVGSGIMAQNLAAGNEAVALLANSLATGAGLYVLIQSLGPISGAHFNPVVSLVEVFSRRMSPREFIGYVVAQLSGAILGVGVAHAIFTWRFFRFHKRSVSGQIFGFRRLLLLLVC